MRNSRQNNLSNSWKSFKRESKGAVMSGLGFTPLGPALNAYELANKSRRTVRAAGNLGSALKSEVRRRIRNFTNDLI